MYPRTPADRIRLTPAPAYIPLYCALASSQLHNQIEDMKGQTRVYARVRPMNEREKSAGCKEVRGYLLGSKGVLETNDCDQKARGIEIRYSTE